MRHIIFIALLATSIPAVAQSPFQNGQLPYRFQIRQEPITVQIQPEPIWYQRMNGSPHQQASYEWVWVHQRVGLFRWRYVPMLRLRGR